VDTKPEDAQNEKPPCEMNAKPKNENLPLEAMNACCAMQDEGVMFEGMLSVLYQDDETVI
jgi:hypothetical protein